MVITTTKTSSTSNSNMKSATNLNASAGTSARTPGSSSKSSVRAIIGKGKPSVNVASPPPTSVSQVNQKMKSSPTANTTDVKSASTSSSKASCNHNDDNFNCTSDGARVMRVAEKELSQQQSSSAGVSVESPQKSSSGTPASTVPDLSVKDSSHKMNSLEGGSKGRDRFTPQQDQKFHQRNSFFRRGTHPPGDSPGSYSQNHISHHSFNVRDAQQHQQPTTINHNLYFTIAKQIEYYFSPESLWKDIFLRQLMDEQGWVPVSVIAGVHQVEQLMKGIPDNHKFILKALKASKIIETNGDKIRKRYDWIKWILPKDGNSTNSEMNNHLRSPNEEGTSEGNKVKDWLKGFSAWDTIEDLKTSFRNYNCKLPKKMEVHDQQMVVADMKALLGDLLSKYETFKTEFGDGAKSSSEWIFEFIAKYPYVAEKPLFRELFSEVVETPKFRKLFSDENDAGFELLDTTIAEDKGKNEEPDEQRVEVLQQKLLKKLLDYDDMIIFLKSFIRFIEKKDVV